MNYYMLCDVILSLTSLPLTRYVPTVIQSSFPTPFVLYNHNLFFLNMIHSRI